jgi:hypothetical protein
MAVTLAFAVASVVYVWFNTAITRPVREQVQRVPWLGTWAACHICFGTWVAAAFGLALWYAPDPARIAVFACASLLPAMVVYTLFIEFARYGQGLIAQYAAQRGVGAPERPTRVA